VMVIDVVDISLIQIVQIIRSFYRIDVGKIFVSRACLTSKSNREKSNAILRRVRRPIEWAH
jgi:hypothetical protein